MPERPHFINQTKQVGLTAMREMIHMWFAKCDIPSKNTYKKNA